MVGTTSNSIENCSQEHYKGMKQCKPKFVVSCISHDSHLKWCYMMLYVVFFQGNFKAATMQFTFQKRCTELCFGLFWANHALQILHIGYAVDSVCMLKMQMRRQVGLASRCETNGGGESILGKSWQVIGETSPGAHHKYVLQDEQYKILESSSESAHTFSAIYQVFIFAQTILFLWITCLNLLITFLEFAQNVSSCSLRSSACR